MKMNIIENYFILKVTITPFNQFLSILYILYLQIYTYLLNFRKGVTKLEKIEYTLGRYIPEWKSGETQTVTFILTEDCNLRCKYCYITHKSSNKKMNFETAKKFIDYLLSSKFKKSPAVVLDFIGGEPLLELELMDKICDYFKIRAYEENCQWWWNYRINIGTNGILFKLKQVQTFLNKNKYHVSVGITLDGTKEKHDLMRVYPDGKGSYDKIIPGIPEYIERFSPSTKVTFASDDLKYLKESIVHLWNIGITEVAANVVFENVWKDKDDIVLEEQLIQLADYAIDNDLYGKVYCTFFNDRIGYFLDEAEKRTTSCGAGKMIALGPDGNIYPCMRYKDYSLNNRNELTIGNVFTGINMEKVRPFMVATKQYQSDNECLNCEIATGCEFCQGFSYDEAKTPTNFQRAKYICKMHKARVRANDYYFSRLFNEKGIKRKETGKRKKLFFLLSSDHISYCSTSNGSSKKIKMSSDTILKGLKYGRDNYMDIFFVHSNDTLENYDITNIDKYTINHIVSGKYLDKAYKLKNVSYVFDENNHSPSVKLSECILNINLSNIEKLSSVCIKLYENVNYIKLNILDLNETFNFLTYYNELKKISSYIIEVYKTTGIKLKLNVLTDIFDRKAHTQCEAGTNSFVLAPNSRFYSCPKIYEEDGADVGNLIDGIKSTGNSHLLKTEFNPLCNHCKSYQCENCRYINRISTGEVNVSPSYQCKKSNLEKLISVSIQNSLYGETITNQIDTNFICDPIETLLQESKMQYGFYQN